MGSTSHPQHRTPLWLHIACTKTWKSHPVTTQSSQFLFDKTLKLPCENTSDNLYTTIFFQSELLALHLNIKNKYNTFRKMTQGLSSAALPTISYEPPVLQQKDSDPARIYSRPPHTTTHGNTSYVFPYRRGR